MKNKDNIGWNIMIVFGLLFLALGLVCISSCKKETIQPQQAVIQNGNPLLFTNWSKTKSVIQFYEYTGIEVDTFTSITSIYYFTYHITNDSIHQNYYKRQDNGVIVNTDIDKAYIFKISADSLYIDYQFKGIKK